MKIALKTAQYGFHAELNESPAAKDIIRHLPIYSTVTRWGDELYMTTHVEAPPVNVTAKVTVGDIAYWPQGRALCVFFGPTPASTGAEPVPASPVVIIGKTHASGDELRQIQAGEKITVEALEEKKAEPVTDTDAARFGNRLLSQSEIDNIVQKLLAEKKSS